MDKKQKEELKAKGKETAKAFGIGLLNGIEKATTWSIDKTKEGYGRYQKHLAEQAELKRVEEENQAKMEKERQLHEEEEARIARIGEANAVDSEF